MQSKTFSQSRNLSPQRSVLEGSGRKAYQSFIRRLATTFLFMLVSALVGCASGPRLVNHSFGFDAVADSPDIDVLDYQYGHSQTPGTKMPDWAKSSTGKSGGTSTTGEMPVGQNLYVKWRIKLSGEVFEDSVDLRSRLPKDIAGHRLYFLIKGRQLHVYLISPRLRPSSFPAVGPMKYHYYQAYVIYPDPILSN